LKQLDSSKPLGPSDIPAWALKDGANYIAEPLTYLINSFIADNNFPRHLKLANVTPLYKKDDPLDPENYRPISVTAALAKVFERTISNQIVEYLNKNNLLSPIQFGFRAKFSTADALLYSIETFRMELDKNKYVAAALLDLSKAFDSISHDILNLKLEKLGFDNSSRALIYDFLTERHQRVVVNGQTSDWISLYQGVPQGTILGPLLFTLYANDMYSLVPPNCKLVQYADDTFIFSSHKNQNIATSNLEHGVNLLVDYFKMHRLTLNAKKTEFMIFCKKSKVPSTVNSTITVDGTKIKIKTEAKYLGPYISESGKTSAAKNGLWHKDHLPSSKSVST
jgi:hypothetical protein